MAHHIRFVTIQIGLITVTVTMMLAAAQVEENKRRLGSALNVGKWRSNSYKSKKMGNENDHSLPGDDELDIVEKRRIGAALNRLSYQYPRFGDADKRRLGAAKNVRYGSWYYRPGEKRRLGAALNHRYGVQASHYGTHKRGIGPALNVVRQDLFYTNDDGKRLGSALSGFRYKDSVWANSDELPTKRRLGNALNARYKSWKLGTSPGNRQKREIVDTQVPDSMAAGESLPDREKKRLGSALNAKYAMTKKPNHLNDGRNKLAGNDYTYGELAMPWTGSESTPYFADLNANLRKLEQDEGNTGYYGTEKRRLGAALNSMSVELKGDKGLGTMNINKDIASTDSQSYNPDKRRLGAALNTAYYADYKFDNPADWPIKVSKSDLEYPNQQPSFGKETLGIPSSDKRRIGAALNVGRRKYSRNLRKADESLADQASTGKTHEKELVNTNEQKGRPAINDEDQSNDERHSNDDETENNDLSSYDSLDNDAPLGDSKAKRRLGAALNTKYQAWRSHPRPQLADKRRIGAALNTGYQSGGRRHLGSSFSPEWQGSNHDKRRIGSALNVKHQGLYYRDDYENQLAEQKRRIGAALNARFRGSSGRSKRAAERDQPREQRTVGDSGGTEAETTVGQAEHTDNTQKRRIGAAKNAWNPNHDSLVTEHELPAIMKADRGSLVNEFNSNKQGDMPGYSQVLRETNDSKFVKRHLGSLIRVGSPFPMTKFSPSRYLRKIDPHQDMIKYYQRQIGQELPNNDLSKAQKYKFYG